MTAPAEQSAAVAPRTGSTIVPTPTANELNAFITQVATGTQPPMPWHHSTDGSPINSQSFDPTAKTTSWP